MAQDLTVSSPAGAGSLSATLKPMPRWLADWLASWDPTMAVPARVASSLPAAIEAARDACRPAERKAVAVLLRQAMRQFRGSDAELLTAFTGQTTEALARYPLDLVAVACRHVVETHRYPKPPTTADFLLPIREELAERQRAVRRLELAAWKAAQGGPETPPRPPSDEERAASLQRAQEVLGKLRTAPRPVPSPRAPGETLAYRSPAEVAAALRSFKLPDADDPRVKALGAELGIPLDP